MTSHEIQQGRRLLLPLFDGRTVEIQLEDWNKLLYRLTRLPPRRNANGFFGCHSNDAFHYAL